MEEKQELKVEEIPKDQLILIGFGKHSLETVLDWRGTEKELDALRAPTLWPSRYRELRICDESDVKRYIEYVEWVSSTGWRVGVAF